MVADCERVAVDVGMRGCSLRRRNEEGGSAEMPAAAFGARREGRMTGPHPAAFRLRLFLTSRGFLGLTAAGVTAGDEVVVLVGGNVHSFSRSRYW